MKIDENPKP